MSDDDHPNLSLIKDHLPPDEMKLAMESMKRSIDDMVEFQQYAARIHRAKYLACIEEGFTEPQALELCKSTRI